MTKAGKLRRVKKRKFEIAVSKVIVTLIMTFGFVFSGMIERSPLYGILSVVIISIGYLIGYIEIPDFGKFKRRRQKG